jgi:hypothetical protein
LNRREIKSGETFIAAGEKCVFGFLFVMGEMTYVCEPVNHSVLFLFKLHLFFTFCFCSAHISQVSIDGRPDLTRMNIQLQQSSSEAISCSTISKPIGPNKSQADFDSLSSSDEHSSAPVLTRRSSNLVLSDAGLHLALKPGLFVCDWHALLDEQSQVFLIFNLKQLATLDLIQVYHSNSYF